MLPKHQPATSIDKIVDLAAFSDFMALKFNDVAFLVARALQQHLADIDLRLQFTGRHASILFSLSLNTSRLREAWRVVAQAIAPFYDEYFSSTAPRNGALLPGPSPRSTGNTHLTLTVPSPHTSREWQPLYLRKIPLPNSTALISSRKKEYWYTQTR
jgi:hypothetical protein